MHEGRRRHDVVAGSRAGVKDHDGPMAKEALPIHVKRQLKQSQEMVAKEGDHRRYGPANRGSEQSWI